MVCLGIFFIYKELFLKCESVPVFPIYVAEKAITISVANAIHFISRELLASSSLLFLILNSTPTSHLSPSRCVLLKMAPSIKLRLQLALLQQHKFASGSELLL